jgi:hypothetical protein
MRTCDAVGVQEFYVLNTKIPRHKKWGLKVLPVRKMANRLSI